MRVCRFLRWQTLFGGPFGRGQGEVYHFTYHHDHIVGLPMFGPIYIPGNKFYFCLSHLQPVRAHGSIPILILSSASSTLVPPLSSSIRLR